MKNSQGGKALKDAQEIAARVAQTLAFELVEVTLQKEPDGMALCLYIDQPGGISLDDCERFHKAVQPLLDSVAYDYLEVSSPGADRPVKTQRDFEKHRGDRVEIKLFAKVNGVKQFTGTLTGMDDAEVAITADGGEKLTFERKAVALIKPVITLEEALKEEEE